MNLLWENYVYWILKKVARNSDYEIIVKAQQQALFWQHPEKWSLRLKPDLLLAIKENGRRKEFVLDTKWKYKSDTSVEDVRQMYTYSHYFPSDHNFLVYPDNLEFKNVKITQGKFYDLKGHLMSKGCGLAFIDLLDNGNLNKEVASDFVSELQKLNES